MHANDGLQETSADELTGRADAAIGEDTNSAPSASGDAQPAADMSTGLDNAPGAENTVDELEGQLAGLQQAMDQIQRGDLDGAEASIVALETCALPQNEEE